MLAEKIQYTDYDGNERNETFYFNLTEAEIALWNLERTGGMKKHLERIMETQDQVEIAKNFRKIIHMAYGEKSEDGRRFMKKDSEGRDLADAFEETEAYSKLIIHILSDPEYASYFVNHIAPTGVQEAIKERTVNFPATEKP